jgi:hypothetical protein
MRAKNLCLLVVISFPYFITRLLTPRCASRGQSPLFTLFTTWLKVIRCQMVIIGWEAKELEEAPPKAATDQVLTRARRAHWRLCWDERFARNARPPTAPSLRIASHGLPTSFAHAFWVSLA